MAALMFVLITLGVVFSAKADYCQSTPYSTYPYCNYNISISARVQDLVSRMTPDDKVSQLGTGASAIQHLDIPSYQWWSEALHGVAGSPGVHFGGDLPCATSFPQVIGLGATFNMTLIRAMAHVISTEARAFANKNQAGLTFFAPNINIFRDPRWGRGQETPGEDPYLTSQYVTQFAKGMQEGEDPRYLKTVVTCKHFSVYNLENFNGQSRHQFNAVVSDQDLAETYLPAFKACVKDGGGGSIMCSYNAVNGVPSCANDLINNKITRDEWGFEGYIVSDCGAVNDIMNSHHYTNTTSDTMRVGLRGGCDLDCGGFYQKNGMDAYNNKAITDEDLNRSITRLYTYRMKLGMFDPPSMQPYMSYSPGVVNTKASQDLALDAARESIVLLKNDGTLPLDMTKHKTVALIGPNANAQGTMQGNYKGTAPYLISPQQGLQNLKVNVAYAQGCDVPCSSTSGFEEATNALKNADVAVIVVGLDEKQESEGHDRSSISLPGNQDALVQTVKKAAPSGLPIIVVLMSGGAVDISQASSVANGVLWVGYPGQSGGQALAEILYGIVNPSGRLPMTFYPADYVNQISFGDMGMRTSPGRTYKFYTGKPVYSFGDGLSYTEFKIDWSKNTGKPLPTKLTHQQLLTEGGVSFEANVTNTGKMAGSTSVLSFITSNNPGDPIKQLFGFEKVFLNPGESTTVYFFAGPEVFTRVDTHGKRSLSSGLFTVQIGDLSRDIFLNN